MSDEKRPTTKGQGSILSVMVDATPRFWHSATNEETAAAIAALIRHAPVVELHVSRDKLMAYLYTPDRDFSPDTVARVARGVRDAVQAALDEARRVVV